jgi:transposase
MVHRPWRRHRHRLRSTAHRVADNGSTDDEIARNVAVGTSTVYRTKQRFVEEGLQRALSELPRPSFANASSLVSAAARSTRRSSKATPNTIRA